MHLKHVESQVEHGWDSDSSVDEAVVQNPHSIFNRPV